MADYHVKQYSKQLDNQEDDPRSKGIYTLVFPAQECQEAADVCSILEVFSPVKSISSKKGRFIIRYDSRKDALEALENVDVLRVLSTNDEDYIEQENNSKEILPNEGASGGYAEREEASKPKNNTKGEKLHRDKVNIKEGDIAEVFVGRLPDDITEEKLKDFFQDSPFYDLRIVEVDNRKCAFLKTYSVKEANEIVRKKKDKLLDGNRIIVDLTKKTKEHLSLKDEGNEDVKVQIVRPKEKKKQVNQKYFRKKGQPKTEVDTVAGIKKDIETKIKKLTEKEATVGQDINRLNRERNSIRKEIRHLELAKEALKAVPGDISDERNDPDQTIPMVVASSKASRESIGDIQPEEALVEECEEGATGGTEKSYILGCEGEEDDSEEIAEQHLMINSQLEKIYSVCVSTLCKPERFEKLPKELEIVVTHIEDNKYFWGILNNKEYEEDLEKFNALEDILNQKSNHEKFIRQENKCGAPFEDNFSRACVQNISGKTATVFFIDYGNLALVDTDKLVGLPSKCWNLRPQARPFKIADSDYFKLSKEDLLTSIKASTSTRRDNLEEDMDYVAVLEDVFPLLPDE